ncbi:MAG: class I SAM-dependent methyltransferase [Micavibrio sp.]|nr:class I SAM-dependent methyltransferase [Micavibrio sp.]
MSIAKNTGGQAWSGFYADLHDPINFFPENFVSRVFLSEKPVSFLDKSYRGEKILDIGCGYGRHIPFLRTLGLDVSGLEVSEELVVRLQSDFPDSHFYCGLSSKTPCKDDTFDMLLACNSIYYLESEVDDIRQNFSECARILNNNGVFIFSMLGAKHSILKGSMKRKENAVIKQDFLGFRNETVIRPLWTKNDIFEVVDNLFDIEKRGEILEECEGFVRHLHYFVARTA